MKGIHFIGQTNNAGDVQTLKDMGFDAVNIVRLFDFFKQNYSIFEKIHMKIMRIVFKKGRIIEYAKAAKFFSGNEDRQVDCYPTII